MKINSRYHLLWLLLLLLFSGCAAPTNKPLRVLKYPAPRSEETPQAKSSDTLIVLLHGRMGAPEDFEKHQWISRLRAKYPDADMVAPDVHLGYYRGRTITKRLHHDIILPAKQRGVKRIYLSGISMGSLGSLLYESEHPGNVDGFLLVAPFLGYGAIEKDLKQAGSLKKWSQQLENEPEKWQPKFWRWLAEHSSELADRVHIGYAKDDGYVVGQQFFASLMHEPNVIIVEGKHRFNAFTAILDRFLKDHSFSES
ncbi:MAG: alpha/beta hydrolase [Verrucomicrobiae bacterium]|nr:alpha/beta hydrolase [Verrucomicrobiae bacterium]NNJ87543.1 alpha/beta hydrolase [Akkermansiaceae bacterium]